MFKRVQANQRFDNSDNSKAIEGNDDPRIAMAQVNRQIVAFQSAGEEVPARLLRLSKALAGECIAQSQGR